MDSRYKEHVRTWLHLYKTHRRCHLQDRRLMGTDAGGLRGSSRHGVATGTSKRLSRKRRRRASGTTADDPRLNVLRGAATVYWRKH